jgi:hypothetical protein
MHRSRLLLMVAVALSSLLAACAGGGGQPATPTPTQTTGGGQGPQATATPTPTQPPASGGGGGTSGGLQAPPQDADHIYLELVGGPDQGNYLAFYNDSTPFCFPDQIAALTVSYVGISEGDTGSSLSQFSLISPDPDTGQTSEFFLVWRIFKGAENREYELIPFQGKGTGNLSVRRGTNSYDIQILGTTADGVTFNGGVVCHN